MKSDHPKNLIYLNDAVLATLRMTTQKSIIGRFVQAGCQMLNAHYGYSYLLVGSPSHFELLYKTPSTPYTPKEPRKSGIVAKTFQKKHPVFLSDVTRVGYVRSDAKHHMRGVVVIPITYRKDTYGTILLCFNDTHTFTLEEKTVCTFIGNSAAQALTIHRLYRDLQNFKQTLDQTLDLIFMFDPHTLTLSYANKEARHRLGITEKAVGGLSATALQTTFTKTAFAQLLEEVRRDPKGARVTELTLKSANGRKYPAETLLQYSHIPGQTPQFVAVVRDVRERKRAERKIQRVAYFDSLTKLPNRAYFLQQLEAAIQDSGSEKLFAVLFLDLDRFKLINDILGHAAGDKVIRQAASRLRASVKEKDLVARLGGDEFVLLLRGVSGPTDAITVARRIIAQFKQPFSLEEQEVYVNTSIGIALYPEDGQDSITLLKAADRALYRVKEEGGGGFQQIRRGKATPTKQLEMEKLLRTALHRNQFVLYYHPQIRVDTGTIESCEALLRWQHPELGFLTPEHFITIAEETGLITEIGRWVIQQALIQHKQWLVDGLPPIRIGVNLSARQLLQSDLANFVRIELAHSGVKSEFLEFELTESMVMKNVDLAMDVLNQFSRMGIRCLMDDFGTGYTSIDYLKRLPIDVVKIDKSFVDGLPKEPHDRAIVNAIILLAHEMHKLVVAEGVETQQQWDFLASQKCDLVQGYWLSKPLTGPDFGAWLSSL